MLGRNGNIAYIRYDSQGQIVPGGPIISPFRPKTGNWQAVSNMKGTNTTGTNGNILRAFIRVDMFGRVVPSSLVIQTHPPLPNNSGTAWIEIDAVYRGINPATTTTTTTGYQRLFFATRAYCEYQGIRLLVGVTLSAYNPEGGSGHYEFGNTAFATRDEALANTEWTEGVYHDYVAPVISPASYWLVMRDKNNPEDMTAVEVLVEC